MRRLFLHIGTQKTGTSFLQTVLPRHRDQLFMQDIYIPLRNLDGLTAHYQWQLALQNNPSVASAALAKLADDQKSSTVLLSSESFYKFFVSSNHAKPILDSLRKYFEVTFIVVFRRPDEFWESLFQQCQKDHPAYVTPPGTTIQTWNDLWPFDFYSNYRFLNKVLGVPVRAVAFPSKRSKPTAIVDRVLAAMGAEPIEWADISGARVNSALPRRQTMFLSAIDKTPIPAMPPILKALRTTTVIADDGVKHLASPEEREAFWRKRLADNQRLADEIGCDDLHEELCVWSAPKSERANPWFAPAPLSQVEMREGKRLVNRVARQRRQLLAAKRLLSPLQASVNPDPLRTKKMPIH